MKHCRSQRSRSWGDMDPKTVCEEVLIFVPYLDSEAGSVSELNEWAI